MGQDKTFFFRSEDSKFRFSAPGSSIELKSEMGVAYR